MARLVIVILLIGLIFYPQTTKAVIPPDFIFNIGTQVTQFFSLVTIFFLSIFGIFFNFFKNKFLFLKYKKTFLSLIILLIILVSSAISYYYATLQQKVEYQKWLEQSNKIKNLAANEQTIKNEQAFFENNKNQNIFVTNQEFKTLTDNPKNDYLVLDTREDLEYENGYFPGSIHIRFADLKAGRWLELPKDKFVYVICWSGIRGKEVAEFLRTKKISGSYLEKGANGWFEFGGKWIGNIKFGEKYTDKKYQIVFETAEVKKQVQKGVILVDTREPDKFKKGHIAGSINIPIMYTATINLENTFSQVPKNSQIITVCDDYVNCFDAKITGVELEERGHLFLGRYNKPWEYEQTTE